MAGYIVTADNVNNRAGSVAALVRDALEEAAAFKAWLDTKPDADLVTLGMLQADVTTVKSAMGDLNQLQTIYLGTANLSVAKDFRTFAKLLVGLT